MVSSERYKALGRPEKILLAMGELSEHSTQALSYEDIVVKSWRLFPQDFGLRNYSDEFPDASDIHKPLYGRLKKTGMVQSGNKKFKLTGKALGYLEELTGKVESAASGMGDKGENLRHRLSRDMELELERMQKTKAYEFFVAGEAGSILDTDFFAFFGATVRTKKQEFLGRLNTTQDAVSTGAERAEKAEYVMLKEVHDYLIDQFQDVIRQKS